MSGQAGHNLSVFGFQFWSLRTEKERETTYALVEVT